jgi:hypothetical protein
MIREPGGKRAASQTALFAVAARFRPGIIDIPSEELQL